MFRQSIFAVFFSLLLLQTNAGASASINSNGQQFLPLNSDIRPPASILCSLCKSQNKIVKANLLQVSNGVLGRSCRHLLCTACLETSKAKKIHESPDSQNRWVHRCPVGSCERPFTANAFVGTENFPRYRHSNVEAASGIDHGNCNQFSINFFNLFNSVDEHGIRKIGLDKNDMKAFLQIIYLTYDQKVISDYVEQHFKEWIGVGAHADLVSYQKFDELTNQYFNQIVE